MVARSRRRRRLIRRLGIRPSVKRLVRGALDEATKAGAVDHATAPSLVALDAGCGKASALARYRPRLGRVVGADLHAPAEPLPYLDEFVLADVCSDGREFEPASFDVILSSFTIEHFDRPQAAFDNLHRWLRPGGTLVATTVNRRHPFVNAYLSMPDGARRRLQPFVKASSADAHPIVGACNDPQALRAGLMAAGFTAVELQTVGHLAHAWGRRLPSFLLGLLGDLLAQGIPSRRSTIVIVARA